MKLKDVLVKYRIHDNQISKIHEKVQKEVTLTIQKEYLLSAGFTFSDEEIIKLQSLQFTNFNNRIDLDCFRIMDEFYFQNKKCMFFDDVILISFLAKCYKNYLFEIKKIEKEVYKSISNSLIYRQLSFTLKQKMSIQFKRFM